MALGQPFPAQAVPSQTHVPYIKPAAPGALILHQRVNRLMAAKRWQHCVCGGGGGKCHCHAGGVGLRAALCPLAPVTHRLLLTELGSPTSAAVAGWCRLHWSRAAVSK